MSLIRVEVCLYNGAGSDFYFTKDKRELVGKALEDYKYESVWTFHVERLMDGLPQRPQAICEYVFDVTNNPSRQEEREVVYGRGRSLSVGDLVQVDGVMYLCDSTGWLVI